MKNWKEKYAHLIECHQRHVLVVDTEGVLLRPALRLFLVEQGYTFLVCRNRQELESVGLTFLKTTDKRCVLESREEYAIFAVYAEVVGVKKILYKKLFPNINTDFLFKATDADLDLLSHPYAKIFEPQTEVQTTALLTQIRQRIAEETTQKARERLGSLEKYLAKLKIEDPQDPSVWQRLMPQIAEAKRLRQLLKVGMSDLDWNETINRLNTVFQNFIGQDFRDLHSRSWRKQPYAVSRILDYIRDQKLEKVALLVVDGMSFLQWRLLAERLDAQNRVYTEGVTFAFVPTITAWSRQAIFRGDLPDLQNTRSEEALFKAYWSQNGESRVSFQKVSFLKNDNPPIDHQRIVGIVTNDLDELMHAEKMGEDHLLDNTEKWLDNRNNSLIDLIEKLKTARYTVFLTADHGNVEAYGIGNLNLTSRNVSISRSKRHIFFSETVLQDRFLASLGEQRVQTYEQSVFLQHQEAFCPTNETVVTHGGSHFWEVLVPFIKI